MHTHVHRHTSHIVGITGCEKIKELVRIHEACRYCALSPDQSLLHVSFRILVDPAALSQCHHCLCMPLSSLSSFSSVTSSPSLHNHDRCSCMFGVCCCRLAVSQQTSKQLCSRNPL